MACFKINIGAKTLTIKAKESNISVNNLVNSLSDADNIDTILKLKAYLETTSFTQQLKEAEIPNDKVFSRTLNASQSKNLLWVIKDNLEKYGVKMEIVNDSEIKRLLNISNTEHILSFVLNGIIYVKEGVVDVTTPLHELSHLLLGVLRVTDTENYIASLLTFINHPDIKQILDSIKNNPVYSSSLESDLQEEALVRYIELLLHGETDNLSFLIGDTDYDVIMELNALFAPLVTKVLGIKSYPGFLTFFKSLILDVPVFGSTIFLPLKLNSTGFKRYYLLAVNSRKVSSYINLLVENKLIQIVNCV